jgi:DNA repair photolyase
MLDPDTGSIRNTGEASPVIDAIAPVIISASRSTDIPALYGDWFMERLKRGYVTWTSPFNGRIYPVSFAKTRVFVFWSKNFRPFLPALKDLIRNGRQIIALYTLNDYQAEGLEPGIPSLEERIRTFHELSSVIGRGRLTWRFDPLILSDSLTVKDLLCRIGDIGDRIAADAGRLIISFIDIEKYDRVKRNLASAGISGLREFSDEEIRQLATGLSELNENWKLEIQVCGEEVDLSQYGIAREGCISFDLLAREFSSDPLLMEFLQPSTGSVSREKRKRELKDRGQRGRCGCIVSKDIGRYSTCIHGCRYCYAMSSPEMAEKNYQVYCDYKEQGIFLPGIIR